MDKTTKEKLLGQLNSSDRRAVESLGEYDQEKALEMLSDGWRISKIIYHGIEMVRGYHYKIVESNGRCYTI